MDQARHIERIRRSLNPLLFLFFFVPLRRVGHQLFLLRLVVYYFYFPYIQNALRLIFTF